MPSNLSLKVMGECTQGNIDEFTFYSGEDRTIKLQIYDTIDDQKYWLPEVVELTLYFPSTGDDDLSIADASITIDSNDRSIITAPLTAANTAVMMTGWVKLLINTGVSPATSNRWVVRELAIKKLTKHD